MKISKTKTAKVKSIKIFESVVGDLEISTKRWKFFELKPNCNYLYFIKDSILDRNSFDTKKSSTVDWIEDISDLMKLIYEGIKDEKLTIIPEKLGYFEIQQANIHFKFVDKKELKKEFQKKLNSPFFNRPEQFQFITKEEFEWIKNNYETIIDNIDLQLITWEQLIDSIEDAENQKDFEQFYKKCMITLYYL